ncbi:S24 family peptidase [Devosia sp.]|uniref:S24 family peptidase n=1 Tax=Devosia sp. TaxID=1871048 RepID=UPI002B002550|nr:S24 family peptidase [Devosia sp.]
MKTLGARIRAARTALRPKVTQKDVADHFGIERVNVTQWEGDTTKPDGYRIPGLASFLGVSEEWLRDGTGDGPDLEKAASKPTIIPGRELVSRDGETLPIYAGAKGGDGFIIVTFDEIERVKMPSILQGVKGGYGLLIDGDSMIPAYFPNDIALINPNKRPERGFHHVFYHQPPHGDDAEAIVKWLEGFNDREWTLKQWNPASEFKESRQVWQTCHRVVGKYDRR